MTPAQFEALHAVEATSAAALDRAVRVLQRNGFGHYDSQRAAQAIADAGLLADSELALARADLVLTLEHLHACLVWKERLLVDNIRLRKQQTSVGT